MITLRTFIHFGRFLRHVKPLFSRLGGSEVHTVITTEVKVLDGKLYFRFRTFIFSITAVLMMIFLAYNYEKLTEMKIRIKCQYFNTIIPEENLYIGTDELFKH